MSEVDRDGQRERRFGGWSLWLAGIAAGGWIVAAALAMGQRTEEPVAAKAPNPLVSLANRYGLPEPGSATATKLRIGDVLPSIASVDLDGKPVKLEDLCGPKATLIICWSTDCYPCMAALSHEASLARSFYEHGLRVIGVNSDDNPQHAKMAALVLSLPWTNVHAPADSSEENFVARLGIAQWPTLLLFDGERKLIAASPELNMIWIGEDAARNAYAVSSLDWMLVKTLGPLQTVPVVLPVQ